MLLLQLLNAACVRWLSSVLSLAGDGLGVCWWVNLPDTLKGSSCLSSNDFSVRIIPLIKIGGSLWQSEGRVLWSSDSQTHAQAPWQC